MFDSTKEDLKDLLQRAKCGELQLPEFQRDYVWNDDDVRSLIASVAKGFPVGALLTLETGGKVRFKPRVLKGVSASSVEPEELLLDGQQRMTSLYQSMMSEKPVRTRLPKGKEVDRLYYLDMAKAASKHADIGDAIVGVPADKVLRSDFGRKVELDLSTPEQEYANHMFPLNTVFDAKDWFYGWRDYWKAQDEDHYQLEKDFDRNVVERIARYKMPVIRLDRDNSREAICLVFEKVNVGGKKLDAFELVTAIYAGSEFDLREDWLGTTDKPGRKDRIKGQGQAEQDIFAQLSAVDFLQACTILHTRDLRAEKAQENVDASDLPQVTCRREALLALPLAGYTRYADRVEAGFKQAGHFLNEQKIIWHKDVPYPIQAVALAAVYAVLGSEAESAPAKKKLERWYWCGVLGELYGSATETRIARDVVQLIDWIAHDGPEPRTIEDSYFQAERLHSLRIRISAAYKGLHALLMREGCRDFVTGKAVDLMTFWNDDMDIHHVFPRKWCDTAQIEPSVYNAIVNKTPLARATNIAIGGDAPSVYLKKIEERHEMTPDELDALLRTHLIEPEHLRNDDFEAFYQARLRALAGMISDVTGKQVRVEEDSSEPEYPETEPESEAAE